MENVQPWYGFLTQYVAIPGLTFTIVTFIWLYYRRLTLKVLPERQIQITKGAFNILFTVICNGPTIKWNTYKIMFAKVITPDGRSLNFDCMAYVKDKPNGQEVESRNVPVAVNGGSSKFTTGSFQSMYFPEWIIGEYIFEFNILDANDRKIKCPKLKFRLDSSVVTNANTPMHRPDQTVYYNIMMIPCSRE